MSRANIWADFWWGVGDEQKVGEYLQQTFDALESQHAQRIQKIADLTGHYRRQVDVPRFDPQSWRLNAMAVAGPNFTFNVTRCCIDVAVARLSLREPMAIWSTFAGDQEQKQVAQARTKLAAGVIQQQRAYGRVFVKALKDCAIGDLGCVKPFPEGKGIRLKRIHPSRLFWDEAAALDDDPPSLYELSYPTIAELLALYPQKAAEISTLKGIQIAADGRQVRNCVKAVEAYHPARGEAPGCRAIVCEGQTILVEKWDGPWPHKFVRWDGGDVLGFSAISAAEQLYPLQEELNFSLGRVRENAELNAVPYWLVPKGAEIDEDALGMNTPGRQIPYIGDKPELVIPPIIHPQMLEWIDRVYQRGFELVGISEFSATSKMPGPRMESGEALRAYQEPESVRFSPLERAFQDLVVDVSEEIPRCVRRLAKTNPNYKVNYLGRDRTLVQVNWSDAEGDDDRFTVYAQAQSGLPLQPAARLSRVAELARDQVIDRATFVDLAGPDLLGPDIEEWWELANGPMKALRKIFDALLASGKYTDQLKPFPAQPGLELGVQLAMSYIARAISEGQPEKKTDLLQMWIADAASIIQARTAPPPAPGAGVVPVQSGTVAPAPPPLGPAAPLSGPAAPPQAAPAAA